MKIKTIYYYLLFLKIIVLIKKKYYLKINFLFFKSYAKLLLTYLIKFFILKF